MPQEDQPDDTFDEDTPVQESGEFDEDDTHAGDHDDEKKAFDSNEKTADVYTEEGREELTENDEITPAEEGFTKGAEEEFLAICAHCGKVLGDRGQAIEKKNGEHTYWFCSDKCAAKGKSVR